MRRLLLSTAAVILLAVPALAQPHGNRGEEHSNRVGKASVAPQVQDRAQAQLRGQGQPQQQAQPQQGGGGQGRGNERRDENRMRGTPPSQSAVLENRGDQQGRFQDRGERDRGDRGRIENRNGDNRFSDGDRRTREIRPDQRPDFGRQDFNRDGRTDYRPDYRRGAGYGGPRHDFSGFRDFHRNFNASHRFRAPFYRQPAGWYDRRWSFGEFLPSAFWARDYWLDDFAEYDLPPPPYGAVWVRVGRDALLVDEDSGEIITVAYSVFY